MLSTMVSAKEAIASQMTLGLDPRRREGGREPAARVVTVRSLGARRRGSLAAAQAQVGPLTIASFLNGFPGEPMLRNLSSWRPYVDNGSA
jgi:hypothetical protein